MPRRYEFWEHVAIGSPEYCWPWTAYVRTDGYGRFRDGLAHRAAFEIANGPIPKGMLIDHICHNRACVNPSHLRLATVKQNNENLKGAQTNSKTGVRGVTWVAHASLFRVRVEHNYERYEGGYFKTLEEADEAAKALRNRLFTYNDVDRRSTDAQTE